VGDGDSVQLGEASGPADATASPLLIGSTLEGNLEQVEVYDLARTPLATFSNGVTTLSVTLDGQGTADVPILSTGALFDPGSSAPAGAMAVTAGAEPAASTSTNYELGPRGILVRFYEAPDPSGAQQQSAAGVFFSEAARRLGHCGEGLGTGEGQSGLAIACDLTASLIPVLSLPQAGRDLVVTATHFVKGKRSVGDYVKAGLALTIIVAHAIPVVATVVKGFDRAAVALKGTSAEAKLAEKALQATEELARTGTTGVGEEGLIRIINGENAAVRDALVALETGMTNGRQGWERLERLGQIFGHEHLVQTLYTISKTLRPETIERLIQALDRLGLKAGEKLSAEALEGVARFMERAPTNTVKHVVEFWEVIARAPNANRLTTFQNAFEWIRQGEAAGMGVGPLAASWEAFLRKGLGAVTNSNVGLNAAKGAYHTLEYMATKLGFQSVRGLEIAERNGERFIDIVADVGGTIHRFEMKNLVAGAEMSSHFRAEVVKDIDQVLREVLAEGKKLNPANVGEALAKQHYVFRGTAQESAKVVEGLLKKLREALGPELAEVASHAKIEYLGRSLPF
jgi:hypothetical protein